MPQGKGYGPTTILPRKNRGRPPRASGQALTNPGATRVAAAPRSLPARTTLRPLPAGAGSLLAPAAAPPTSPANLNYEVFPPSQLGGSLNYEVDFVRPAATEARPTFDREAAEADLLERQRVGREAVAAESWPQAGLYPEGRPYTSEAMPNWQEQLLAQVGEGVVRTPPSPGIQAAQQALVDMNTRIDAVGAETAGLTQPDRPFFVPPGSALNETIPFEQDINTPGMRTARTQDAAAQQQYGGPTPWQPYLGASIPESRSSVDGRLLVGDVDRREDAQDRAFLQSAAQQRRDLEDAGGVLSEQTRVIAEARERRAAIKLASRESNKLGPDQIEGIEARRRERLGLDEEGQRILPSFAARQERVLRRANPAYYAQQDAQEQQQRFMEMQAEQAELQRASEEERTRLGGVAAYYGSFAGTNQLPGALPPGLERSVAETLSANAPVSATPTPYQTQQAGMIATQNDNAKDFQDALSQSGLGLTPSQRGSLVQSHFPTPPLRRSFGERLSEQFTPQEPDPFQTPLMSAVDLFWPGTTSPELATAPQELLDRLQADAKAGDKEAARVLRQHEARLKAARDKAQEETERREAQERAIKGFPTTFE